MTYFHSTVKWVKMIFDKDHILFKNLCIYKNDILNKSCQKNFQLSIEITTKVR